MVSGVRKLFVYFDYFDHFSPIGIAEVAHLPAQLCPEVIGKHHLRAGQLSGSVKLIHLNNLPVGL
jgi:hypothetical protein